MAYTTYETGIRCNKCGNLITTVSRFKRRVLCQECGTHLMDLDDTNALVTKNAKIVTVKVTHKLFSDIYEEVEI